LWLVDYMDMYYLFIEQNMSELRIILLVCRHGMWPVSIYVHVITMQDLP